MKEIKIFKNYGCLAAEKRYIYTYGSQAETATCSDVLTVKVPEEWELYKNQMGEIMVKSPWGWCYEINEVLTDLHNTPTFRALDKSGYPHTAYLYTAEELEEKKKRERKGENHERI